MLLRLTRWANAMGRKNYLQNNFFLVIGLMISTFLQRRNATDTETELARAKDIAVKGRLADEVTADFAQVGFTCVDVSDDELGIRHNASKVILCQKEFREKNIVFPKILNVFLLFAGDDSLISFENSIVRLSL